MIRFKLQAKEKYLMICLINRLCVKFRRVVILSRSFVLSCLREYLYLHLRH